MNERRGENFVLSTADSAVKVSGDPDQRGAGNLPRDCRTGKIKILDKTCKGGYNL